MPPDLALLLTLGFIAYLFRRDFRERPDISGAVWVPLIWVFLVATRPVSKWLALFGFPTFLSTSAEGGSPLDAFIFFSLIGTAAYILGRRQINWSTCARDNKWVALFLLYCFAAIFWSDFPFSSFKRWIKVLGHPLIVLLLFTETQWEEAVVRIIKRCAYIIFPISICWLKYFPNLGRSHNEFGIMNNTGIAEGKNELGALCLYFLLFLLWHLLRVLKQEKGVSRRNEIRLIGVLMLMALYCLGKAHSATSSLSFLLGASTVLLLGLRIVNKRAIGVYLATAVILLVAAQMTVGLFDRIIDWSGHEATIEGRGRLWSVLLQTDADPMVGTGFESYWLGQRVQRIWSMPEFWWHPNQAHNGYLELYLNLGIIGLCIFVAVILATLSGIRRELLQNLDWGRVQLGCLLAMLAHNWTEAGFKGLSVSFFFFFLIAIKSRYDQDVLGNMEARGEPEVEVAYAMSKQGVGVETRWIA